MPIDELTGLHDRKEMRATIRQELNRSKRTGRQFALLFIDIDRFKDINDTNGHLRGDLVLMETAEVIKKTVRDLDVACRYGGDEFIVILPETDRQAAASVARRMLDNIGAHVFKGVENQPDINLGVSIGVTGYRPTDESDELLLDRADRALYAAKKTGRGKVVMDSEVEDRTPLQELDFGAFIDRTDELETLKQRFNAARRGEGSLVVIAGEAGIGKTRLVAETATYFRTHNPRCISSRPFDYGITPPYYVYFQIVKEILEQADTGFITGIPLVYRSQLAVFLPEMCAKLAAAEVAPLTSPEHEKMRLYDAIYQVIERAAIQQPLFLFLDDMQWVRETDLELLGYLVRRSRELPVLFCVAYRREEIGDHHPLTAFLGSLSRNRLYLKLDLKAFSEADTDRKLSSIFKKTVPAEISRLVASTTRGNPFYIEETVKSMIDGGGIFWDGKQWSFKETSLISVPATINDLLQRRLAGLEDDVQELLTIASAVGRNLALPLLAHLTNKNEGHVLQLLDKTVRRHILTADPAGTYVFANYFLARMFYNRLNPARRRHMHLQIGQAIERAYGDRLQDYYEDLVYHYERAEDWSKVFDYCYKTGCRSRDIYARQEAIADFQRCLRYIEEGKVTGGAIASEIRMSLGKLQLATADYDAAKEHFLKVLAEEDLPAPVRVEALINLCASYERTGENTRSLQLYEDARQKLDPSQNRREIAMINNSIIWLHVQQCNYAKAAALIEPTLTAFTELGMDQKRIELLNIIGIMHYDQGEWDVAEEYFKQVDDYWRGRDYQPMAASLNNLAAVYNAREDVEKSLRYQEQYLELCRRSGDRFGTSLSLQNTGNIQVKLGNWDKAMACYREGTEIGEQINAIPRISIGYLSIGRLLYLQGDLASARDYVQSGKVLAEQNKRSRDVVYGLETLARIHLENQEIAEARRAIEDSMAISTGAGIKDHVCTAMSILGEIQLKQNRPAEAKESAEKAVAFSRSMKYQECLINAYIIAAKADLHFGNIDAAITTLNQALALCANRNNHTHGQCRLYLGIALRAKNDFEGARRSLAEARQIFQQLGASRMLRQADEELKTLASR